MGYSPWGHKESDTAEQLTFSTALVKFLGIPEQLRTFFSPSKGQRKGQTVLSTKKEAKCPVVLGETRTETTLPDQER